MRVVSIQADELNGYAEQLAEGLLEHGIHAECGFGSERMNAKIRQAQLMKVPYMLVVGKNENGNQSGFTACA